MALRDPIPVRFSDPADAGLAKVSARTSLSKAELIRIAVDEFLEKTERTGEIVQRHYLATQSVKGRGHTISQTNNFPAASESAPAPKQQKYPAGKRGKKSDK